MYTYKCQIGHEHLGGEVLRIVYTNSTVHVSEDELGVGDPGSVEPGGPVLRSEHLLQRGPATFDPGSFLRRRHQDNAEHYQAQHGYDHQQGDQDTSPVPLARSAYYQLLET